MCYCYYYYYKFNVILLIVIISYLIVVYTDLHTLSKRMQKMKDVRQSFRASHINMADNGLRHDSSCCRKSPGPVIETHRHTLSVSRDTGYTKLLLPASFCTMKVEAVHSSEKSVDFH
jgi:hypothetical protein